MVQIFPIDGVGEIPEEGRRSFTDLIRSRMCVRDQERDVRI